MNFKLFATDYTDSGEVIYLYVHNSADHGHKAMSFSAHPTIPFEWQIHKSVNMTTVQRNKVIAAFVNAGMDRATTGKTFEEMIETLTIEM